MLLGQCECDAQDHAPDRTDTVDQHAFCNEDFAEQRDVGTHCQQRVHIFAFIDDQHDQRADQ